MLISFENEIPADTQAIAFAQTSADVVQRRLAALGDGLAEELGRASAAATGFAAGLGEITEFFTQGVPRGCRVLLVGLGKDGAASANSYEKFGGTLSAHLINSGETRLVIDVSDTPAAAAEAAARVAYGALLRVWQHDAYRTRKQDARNRSLCEIVIVGADKGARAAWMRMSKIAEGVKFARTLVTEPGNVIFPESFVARCQFLKEMGVEIEVLDEKDMQSLGMGAFLGVAQGSARRPRLLSMRWAGAEADPLVVVGKGVTFDSGGLSLKPAEHMDGMKWDMAGAATVAGMMHSLAGRKAKAHVVGICALAENMPDGAAQRPGDVISTMSGQTVEVVNTDGEGRLVLCDSMTWAQRNLKPAAIIDIATLTGAMVVTLGHERAGYFANNNELAKALDNAAEKSGELLWRMPLDEAYDKLLESPIADMRNMGTSEREGGAISAAKFLQRFIEGQLQWAHIDIAGMAWAAEAGNSWDKGATGYGVRLLEQLVADSFEH